MYSYIKGLLVEATPPFAIVEAQGIGFLIQIPLNQFSELPSIGSCVQLYTTHIVREDFEGLYGFLTQDYKKLFERLIPISGIGPKTALSLVGHMTPSDLYAAIQASDVHTLCKIPGIGKKTAERLILELRSTKPFSSSVSSAPSLVQDAASALINLGYNPSLVEKTLDKIMKQGEKPTDLSTLIGVALRSI